ncbi:MAG: spore coat protein [Halanaerobiales bacterium]
MPTQTVQQPAYKQREIKNAKSETVPEVKGPGMNDRDFINDILATEKYLTDNYNVFTREASHGELYNDVKNILIETHDKTRQIFNTMFEEGFYTLEAEEKQKVKDAQQQFTNYFNSQKTY